MERGEVYYLRFDGGFGSEMATGRPCVVVSSQRMITVAQTVTIVYLTTSPKQLEDKVELTTPKRQSWARCDQIYTIDKTRLSDFMCKLTSWEMDDIDRKLMDVLGLQQSVEVQEVIEQVNVGTNDIALRVELDTYKRLYSDLVKQITDARFERQVVVEKAIATEEKAVEESEVVEELNIEDLAKKMSTPNIELDEPPKKKAGRPITSGKYCRPTVDELVEYKKSGKANINKDDWKTIAATTGMNVQTAQNIVAWRNKHGDYIDLDDLLFVPRFGSGCMNKYGHMLEA